MGLLQKQILQNLQTEKFPSHMIISRKQDLLKIQEIDCTYPLSEVNLTPTSIDLSNLEILSKLTFILYFILVEQFKYLFLVLRTKCKYNRSDRNQHRTTFFAKISSFGI